MVSTKKISTHRLISMRTSGTSSAPKTRCGLKGREVASKARQNSEPSGVVRRTISLSRDLDDRMTEATERYHPNWSSIAVKAFEAELRFLKTTGLERGAMSELIDRLRREEAEEAGGEFETGVGAGVAWSQSKDSGLVALRALAAIPEEWVSAETTDAMSLENELAEKMDSDKDFFRRHVLKLLPDEEPSTELLWGFHKGVCSVWDQVKGSLRHQ
jgi:hypothetical protein